MEHQFDPENVSQIPEARSWSQDRRLKFIDFRLRWEGRINRTDLMEFFGISAPQASADLAKYSEAAPFNLTYDSKVKSYVRAESFSPIYVRSAPRAYLNELLALSTEVIEPRASFIGWTPEIGIAPLPTRQVDGTVLMILLQAIREKRTLEVEYQGMSKPMPTARMLSPHALAYDGFRWHLRAFCHLRNDFRDFVIARLAAVKPGQASSVSSADDKQWNTMLTLVLGAHPELSEGGRKAIELDYGMVDGQLNLACRHALLFYALHRLGLSNASSSSPAAQQISLLNRKELQPFIDQLTV